MRSSPATFQDHDGHKQHVTEVHNGVWRYICGMCDSIFDTIMDQREHRYEKRCPLEGKLDNFINGQAILYFK